MVKRKIRSSGISREEKATGWVYVGGPRWLSRGAGNRRVPKGDMPTAETRPLCCSRHHLSAFPKPYAVSLDVWQMPLCFCYHSRAPRALLRTHTQAPASPRITPESTGPVTPGLSPHIGTSWTDRHHLARQFSSASTWNIAMDRGPLSKAVRDKFLLV